MDFSFDNRRDLLAISIQGRLDTVSAQNFMTSLEKEMGEDVSNVEIDASGLEYISSSGLRCLMTIYKQAVRNGGTLTLKGLTPQVKEVLDITGMTELFDIR